MSQPTYPPPTALPPVTGLRLGRGLIGWVLFIGLAVMLFMLIQRNDKSHRVIPLSEFTARLEANDVRSVVIASDELYGEFRSPSPGASPGGAANGASDDAYHFRTPVPAGMGAEWGFVQWVLAHRGDAVVIAHNDTNLVVNILLPIVPWLLIFAFIWFFVFRQIRRSTLATTRTVTITGPGRWVPDPPPTSTPPA